MDHATFILTYDSSDKLILVKTEGKARSLQKFYELQFGQISGYDYDDDVET